MPQLTSEKKRITANKACITEVLKGDVVKAQGFEPGYVITDLGRKLSRVRVLGVVVNKFTNEEGTYGFIVLDDATGNMRAKIWQNLKIIEHVNVGDIVDVVGRVREYDDEVYLMPETIRPLDLQWEVLRRAELAQIWASQRAKIKQVQEAMKQIADVEELKVFCKEKYRLKPEETVAIATALERHSEPALAKEEKKSYKDRILKIIEEQDDGTGIEFSRLIDESKLPENIVDSILNELLSDGIIYEPRAGRLRKL